MDTNEITVNKISKKELATLKIKREKGGITLFVKSQTIEEFFNGLSGGLTSTSSSSIWGGGMEYYKIQSFTIPNAGEFARNPNIVLWGTHPLIDPANNVHNFSFLRAKGLSDGVTIQFNGLFVSRDIERFKEDFKTFITRLYVDFIKVVEFEISVSSMS